MSNLGPERKKETVLGLVRLIGQQAAALSKATFETPELAAKTMQTQMYSFALMCQGELQANHVGPIEDPPVCHYRSEGEGSITVESE